MSVAIDFGDPVVRANPYPTYAQLRQEAPVLWNGQSWLISRYDDIIGLLTDDRVSSARTESIFQVLPDDVRQELQPLRHILGSRMLLTDPPTHTRLRNLVTKAFSPRMVREKRPRIQEICDKFVDRVIADGKMDLIADIAVPVPGWVIAEMLGVPPEDQASFTRWGRDQVRVYDRPGTAGERIPIMRQGQASMVEMKAYLEEIIEARRSEPRDDLITMLVMAEEQGDRLSLDELVIMIIALLVGGNNSTAHLIGNSILTLARHPETLTRLRENPELIATAIEEVLRFESPVQATSRIAREAINIGGEVIEAGQGISLLFGSANRDECQFSNPDQLDIARRPNRHLTFAHGPHFCLGAAIARAETQIAVQTVVRRCLDLELESEDAEWQEGFSFRGLKTLPIRFRSA
ncbi:MAG TPA: cytochrome P450 [Nitrolancea sp.]|nr:cytochrome P450 [Nitrolancea sp.]